MTDTDRETLRTTFGQDAELYDRIFLGYGDDSVAQLGGAHVACEWVSNVLTKVLQRPRIGAYLEQLGHLAAWAVAVRMDAEATEVARADGVALEGLHDQPHA